MYLNSVLFHGLKKFREISYLYGSQNFCKSLDKYLQGNSFGPSWGKQQEKKVENKKSKIKTHVEVFLQKNALNLQSFREITLYN